MLPDDCSTGKRLCAPPGKCANLQAIKEPFMKSLAPASIAPPFARYAHGVEVPPGARLVVTSGQLALTAGGVVSRRRV